MAETAVRLVISGRVQGVGFRYWAHRKATALGLDGWVRNCPDGTVEALFAGSHDAVRDMIDACWRGPGMASVSAVREFPAEAPMAPGFRQVR